MIGENKILSAHEDSTRNLRFALFVSAIAVIPANDPAVKRAEAMLLHRSGGSHTSWLSYTH